MSLPSGLRSAKLLKLSSKDIQEATKNFKECIGKGGYGLVYKGELWISGKHTTVAVKMLIAGSDQGLKEFLNEIELLSGQQHQNLVSLLGYCNDGKENSLVYEYAENGSLDKYIRPRSKKTLTWLERLKACASAARGLDYLHNHAGEHQAIIHRDIKSQNILLDKNFVAKIADLGLSKLSLAGLDRSGAISGACGTPGYCEPEYINTGVVKKESDVYSFGVVLFEVLCGKLCNVKHDDGFVLSAHLAKEYYENNKLEELVDPRLRKQMSFYAMTNFSAIAYACLHDSRQQRPVMDVVAKELEETIKIQEEHDVEKERMLKRNMISDTNSDEYWETMLPRDWEVIVRNLSVPQSIYTSKKDLFSYLLRGIYFENNKIFKIDEAGNKCVLILATSFVNSIQESGGSWFFHNESRFYVAMYHSRNLDVRCQIKAGMLSLGAMYEASLVFGHRRGMNSDFLMMDIKWKTGELSVSSGEAAELIPGNMYRMKMWQFINRTPNAEFDIVLEQLSCPDDRNLFYNGLMLQGIEFRPVEMTRGKEIEGFSSLSISDDDECWEKTLPNDYQRYIEMSDYPLRFNSKKELYLLLCTGFLADNGQLWFSLHKPINGISSMLQATYISDNENEVYPTKLYLPNSRFGVAEKLQGNKTYHFKCKLRSPMFSARYTYSCYLVFKLEHEHVDTNDDPCWLHGKYMLDGVFGGYVYSHLCSRPITIPTIIPKNDRGPHYSSNKPATQGLWAPKIQRADPLNGWAEKRKDGWMEVRLGGRKPLHQLQKHVSLEMILSNKMIDAVGGIIVQGIEFRPTELEKAA